MRVELGKIGKIVSGHEEGSYVQVLDDAANTGGFLILTAAQPDMRSAFDNWVENEEMLQRYINEAEWIIEWPR